MSENSSLNDRKLDHLRACMDDSVDLQQDSFAFVKLKYCAFPEMSLCDVSTATDFAGQRVDAPLIISSMTGGVGEVFTTLNRNLAAAAHALNLPLGLGSMKVLLRHREAEASYRMRDLFPGLKIISNLGLVSFNHGLTPDDMKKILDIVRPDVFGFHLNALQEVIQKDGDTNFSGLLGRLEELVRLCPVPVLVKECGGGIAPEWIYRLVDMGVGYVDISGNDGTSWARVEGQVGQNSMGELFKDFGLPSRWILDNIDHRRLGSTRIIASGGIRDGIQAAKAIALGAQYVAVARPFLVAAAQGADEVEIAGRRIISEMRTAMFLTGSRDLGKLDRSTLIERW